MKKVLGVEFIYKGEWSWQWREKDNFLDY